MFPKSSNFSWVACRPSHHKPVGTGPAGLNPHIGSQSASLLAGGRIDMLHYSLVFLIIALIAGFLGFGGVAGAAVGIAKILFFVFLVIWLITFLTGRRAV